MQGRAHPEKNRPRQVPLVDYEQVYRNQYAHYSPVLEEKKNEPGPLEVNRREPEDSDSDIDIDEEMMLQQISCSENEQDFRNFIEMDEFKELAITMRGSV